MSRPVQLAREVDENDLAEDMLAARIIFACILIALAIAFI